MSTKSENTIKTPKAGFYIPVHNSFFNETDSGWLQKHSVSLIFLSAALFAYFIFTFNWGFVSDIRNRRFDEMAVTVVDFGDFVPFRKRISRGGSYVEIDEIFGNQYIKDKSREFNPERDLVDPRIGTAVNPVVSNATSPMDLTPEIMPEYPARARSAGIEGMLTLELIISDEGQVLRAKSVGRILGHGLEQAAVACFEKKRFKPSINSNGERITVKIYQPVRFKLF